MAPVRPSAQCELSDQGPQTSFLKVMKGNGNPRVIGEAACAPKVRAQGAGTNGIWSRGMVCLFRACPAPAPLWGLVLCPHSLGERLCRKEQRGCRPSALELAVALGWPGGAGTPMWQLGERVELSHQGHLEGPDPALSPGLSMRLLESKKGLSYFAFEHSEEYQQTQHKFLAAVESMEPNNIVVCGVHRPPGSQGPCSQAAWLAAALGVGAGGDTWAQGVPRCLFSHARGLASQPCPAVSELGAVSHPW